jgi:hypothetical protein
MMYAEFSPFEGSFLRNCSWLTFGWVLYFKNCVARGFNFSNTLKIESRHRLYEKVNWFLTQTDLIISSLVDMFIYLCTTTRCQNECVNITRGQSHDREFNASTVKIYNATSSLVRFTNKKVYSSIIKNALAYHLQRWRCSCKIRSRRIGSCTLM